MERDLVQQKSRLVCGLPVMVRVLCFKSFVENTVHIAFMQDERKAQEKAERERLNNTSAAATSLATQP